MKSEKLTMLAREIVYYGPSVELNQKKLKYIHDIMSLSLGVAAGVLSLESIWGFIFYVVGITLVNLGFAVVCCEGDVSKFYRFPGKEIFWDGMGNVAGYVMMWCLVYAFTA